MIGEWVIVNELTITYNLYTITLSREVHMLIVFIVINLVTFFAMVLVFRKVMISSSYDETKRLQQQNLENSQKAVELEQKSKRPRSITRKSLSGPKMRSGN